MKIKRITKFNKGAMDDVNKLLLQLSSSGYQVKDSHFKKVLKDKNVYLFLVYDGKKIIGTGTLITMNQFNGLRGRVETVVIDEKYRGMGLGKQLMDHIMRLARKLKMYKVSLTTESYRTAAHGLYEKLGFSKKDAYIYEIKL